MTHSFDKNYWDGIWHGERAGSMAAGEPNPHLSREVQDLRPGTALDAGCGAGAEAIWLAAHGWKVTAADIAAEALSRGAERAATAGVDGQIRWVEADLSSWNPETRYDLVTTHYAHPAMPQLAFYDRIASWVAPGGTLLIVGHLAPENHGPAGGHNHDHGHGHGANRENVEPPAVASATADTITDRLDQALWEVETARESQRTAVGPGGRETPIHDVVVRATRRT